MKMLNAGTGVPAGVTNAASFYTTPAATAATTVQSAIAAGVSPSVWANMSPADRAAALAAASGPATTGVPAGGAAGGAPLIQFSGGGTIPIGYGSLSVSTGGVNALTPAQVQAAVNAGLTPTQFQQLSPAQQAQLANRTGLPGSTANAAMPIVIIGIALFVLLAAGKKG